MIKLWGKSSSILGIIQCFPAGGCALEDLEFPVICGDSLSSRAKNRSPAMTASLSQALGNGVLSMNGVIHGWWDTRPRRARNMAGTENSSHGNFLPHRTKLCLPDFQNDW